LSQRLESEYEIYRLSDEEDEDIIENNKKSKVKVKEEKFICIDISDMDVESKNVNSNDIKAEMNNNEKNNTDKTNQKISNKLIEKEERRKRRRKEKEGKRIMNTDAFINYDMNESHNDLISMLSFNFLIDLILF
jgi:hypothetical protein